MGLITNITENEEMRDLNRSIYIMGKKCKNIKKKLGLFAKIMGNGKMEEIRGFSYMIVKVHEKRKIYRLKCIKES